MKARHIYIFGGLALLALWGSYMKFPRGIRNNNPGNLRDMGIAWQGMIGRDADGFCIFDTMANGIRAAAIDIYGDIIGRGGETPLNTIYKMVSEYAPATDNNNVGEYAAALSVATGRGIFEPLDIARDGVALLRGVIRHENGFLFRRAVSDADILGAHDAALSRWV